MTGPRFIFLVVMVSFTGCTQPPNESSGITAIEKQIWTLEHTYINHHKNANLEGIFPIWHEKFLGWPDDLPDPANKDAVILYTRQRSSAPKSWDFRIEPKGIQVHGDIVINHYIFHISGTSTRVIHSLIREGSQWKILGGMSNRH